MIEYISKSAKQTQKIGAALARSARGGEVFLLIGDLGAGKTTLVQGAAAALGVKNTVTSPTFVLMKVYEVSSIKLQVASKKRGSSIIPASLTLRGASNYKLLITTLVHIDAYRGMDLPSLEAIGATEYFGRPDAVCFVEWGEGLAAYLKKRGVKCYNVRIDSVSEQERLIKIE